MRTKHSNSVRYGFTLIELLIVMTIVGILATISVFAMRGVQKATRDARRKADLEAIRSSLELFKADCGRYPSNLPSGSLSATTSLNCANPSSNIYLQSIPQDPSSGVPYSYSSPDGSYYTLCSHLEDNAITASGCGTCIPVPCRYKTRNP